MAGGEAAQRFAAAHRALVEDGSVQFQLVRPPAPAAAPRWLQTVGEWIAWALRPIGRLLGWIGGLFPEAPYARILLWSVIGLLAAAVLWMAAERVRHGEWRWPRLRQRGRAATTDVSQEERLFEPAPVRAWLREADALAALGRFGEAAHLLLFRSVEDLAKRRPGTVQPALTARELAAAPALPPAARDRFAAIAALVERSLFGGRAVDAGDWQAARADYAEFALPGAWRP
jgi:hypothetical protein